MKIKLTWLEQKQCSKIVDIEITEELIGYPSEIDSIEYLREIITDEIEYPSNDDFLYSLLTVEEKEYFYDALNATIVSYSELTEVVEKLSYLVVPKVEKTCCEESAESNFVYCPVCGTKIIY